MDETRMIEVPRAKKSLGQHWLNDLSALTAMCDAVEVGESDTVLEIGPGLGTLTELLVKRAGEVVAVEFDALLALQLPYRVPRENLTVVQSDILNFDLTTLKPGYKVVANIPYYLTSNLLRILLESTNPPSRVALLVQKEVAERVAAAPGDMSLLSVSVQFYCDASLGQVVPASLFEPAPKVDSQILKLQYKGPCSQDIDSKAFFSVVKAGFSSRRKTLLNSLSAGLRLDRKETAELLSQAGVDPGARAQTLSLDNWGELARHYIQNVK